MIDRTKGWVNELNTRLLSNFDNEEQQVIQRFLKNAATAVDDSTKDK